MKKIAIVVVTYNRKKLLEENLKALLEQKCSSEYSIFVIDNASTDGTEEYIKTIKNDKIIYYNTQKNIGGSGGFNIGLKMAIEQNYDYAWLMDDDSIVQKNSLNSLVTKAQDLNDNFSFLASLVYWTNGKLFKMNVPSIKYKNKNSVPFDLISKYKVMPIETSSFVGCFVNVKYALKVGLPIKEFFIYGDDEEYTMRLRKEEVAYLDLDSSIIHKAPSNKGADIVSAGEERITRFFYQSRNGMYIARKYNKRLKRCKTVVARIFKVFLFSKDNKIKRIGVIIRGTIAGLFFNPQIEIVNTKETEE